MTTTTTNATSSMSEVEYLQIDIECAHLLKNHQTLGVGKMDPFVTLTADASTKITRTPTHWDAHKEPAWFHACPKIRMSNVNQLLTFAVINDSTMGEFKQGLIGQATVSIGDLIGRAHQSKVGSLGGAARIPLTLDKGEGTLVLRVIVKDKASLRMSQTKLLEEGMVDPSWFESPVRRLGVSGGTAPFFSLVLTPQGMEATKYLGDPNHFIGKDLSRAEDEKDFYQEIRYIQDHHTERHGMGRMLPFLFEYLGVLKTKTTDSEQPCQLLVLTNLRNNYRTFRMLDLKMGHITACGGWQGKSRLRSMKQNLLDGITNSISEGFRLEGFDGTPRRIESMDPLMDLLSSASGGDIDNENGSTKTLLWGRQVTEKEMQKAKRIMLQTLTGAEICRYFMDVHLEPNALAIREGFAQLLAAEVAELVLHELVAQLVHLAITCHSVSIPQKWIGSSVALGFDSGLFPTRDAEAEGAIRSKVLVKVFDWGRSELLTEHRYKNMAEADKQDRQKFWDNYRIGIDRLAYNATREYYHHFTNTTGWSQLTLQVMDFDSMKVDDHMGKVDVPLPDPLDISALHKLQQSQGYALLGTNGVPQGVIYCAISWLAFPADSRLVGVWRVTVERATNLTVKDLTTGTSDPYVIVIAQDACRHRDLQQMTCVKARKLNPAWNETIDVPVVRATNLKSAMAAMGGMFDDSFPPGDRELAKLFQFRENGKDDCSYWTECLKKAAASSEHTVTDETEV